MSLINDALKKAQEAQRRASGQEQAPAQAPHAPRPASAPPEGSFQPKTMTVASPPKPESKTQPARVIASVAMITLLFGIGSMVIFWYVYRKISQESTPAFVSTPTATAQLVPEPPASEPFQANPLPEAPSPTPTAEPTPVAVTEKPEAPAFAASTPAATTTRALAPVAPASTPKTSPLLQNATAAQQASQQRIDDINTIADTFQTPPAKPTPVAAPTPAINPTPAPAPDPIPIEEPKLPSSQAEVVKYLEAIEIQGVMGGSRKVLIFDRVADRVRAFAPGDTVNYGLDITVTEIKPHAITFTDHAGVAYLKRF